jgi:hypothetical protein
MNSLTMGFKTTRSITVGSRVARDDFMQAPCYMQLTYMVAGF